MATLRVDLSSILFSRRQITVCTVTNSSLQGSKLQFGTAQTAVFAYQNCSFPSPRQRQTATYVLRMTVSGEQIPLNGAHRSVATITLTHRVLSPIGDTSADSSATPCQTQNKTRLHSKTRVIISRNAHFIGVLLVDDHVLLGLA